MIVACCWVLCELLIVAASSATWRTTCQSAVAVICQYEATDQHQVIYCHAVWCSFVCCFDVWELSEVSFYRAMLCIRGTSHGSVSVCLSQVGVLLKRLNVGSHKQHHTISQGLWFSDAKDLHEIRPGSPPTRAPNAGGVGQNRATFD